MNRLALILAAAVASVAVRPSDTPKVAFVDMSKLVSQNQKSQAEQSLIKDWKEASDKLLEKMGKDFKAAQDALDQFKPGSDDFRKKVAELKVEEFKLNQQQKSLNEELEVRISHSLADAHARVVVACRTYLKSHDIDAILQYTSTPVAGNTRSEVFPDIVVRSVVAYRDTLDVTDAVLAVLDAK